MANDEVPDCGLIDQGAFGYLEELFRDYPQLDVVHLQTLPKTDGGDSQILQILTPPLAPNQPQQQNRLKTVTDEDLQHLEDRRQSESTKKKY